MTPADCEAARALLGWTRERLAQAAPVGVLTLACFEEGRYTPLEKNLLAIKQALEAAGVEFIPENGGGAGVRLRRRQDAGNET